MKNLSILFSILLLISCSNNKKIVRKELFLELINDEIHYVQIDSNSLLNNKNKAFEDIISYKEDERKKAYNLLTFRLVNNSNKKYFFILNTENLGFIGNSQYFDKSFSKDKKGSFSEMVFIIDDKESIKNKIQISYRQNELFKIDSNKIYLDIYEKIIKLKNENNFKEFNNKSMIEYGGNHYSDYFVIYPGEYKIFKTKFFLPIYEEKYNNLNLNFKALIIPPQKTYDFSLGISQKKDFIWNSLLDYQRKEIKDNGYEIFDGELVSNKVPLILIK